MALHWQTIDLSWPTLHIEPADYSDAPMFDSETSGSLLGVARDPYGNENAHLWLGWTYGPAQLGVETCGHEPALDDRDEWETIEQATIDLGPTTTLTRTTLSSIRPPELDQLMALPTGRHGIRVSVRGRDGQRSDLAIRIQLWPTTEPRPLEVIKHVDGFDLDVFLRRPADVAQHGEPAAGVGGAGSDVVPSLPVRPPVSTTKPSSLTAQWRRLHRIVHQRCTERGVWTSLARPSEGENAIERARTLTGVQWPEELREWFGLHNGGGTRELVPGMNLIGVAEVAAVHTMQVSIWTEMSADDSGGRSLTDYAGAPASSEAGMFLREFVPVAERDGTMLVCDTRSGPMHGCITEFGKDTADAYPPKWASLSAMVTDLGDSLEHDAIFDNAYLPELDDSGLSWHVDRR